MADTAYGLWPLVILNTGLFVLCAVSFFHPKTEPDWRVIGDPHLSPFHVASYLFINGGFWLVASAWPSSAATTPRFVPRRRPHTVEHHRQPSRRPR